MALPENTPSMGSVWRAAAGAAIGRNCRLDRLCVQGVEPAKKAETASPPGLDNYNRAMASCLEALGHTVE
ncbi:hypothetical protein [Methylobacter sp. sgz302048]|uniref:hypothetical protein n=1 Tax=Methylobacter sp. sgz302048 TaxID=3455945 RepID=UPI003FA18F6A